MTTWLFVAALLAYVCATAAFFALLWRGDASYSRLGPGALGVAVVLHGGFLASLWSGQEACPFNNIHDTLALGSLVVSVGYLATMRRHRLQVLGAFITPVALLMLLGAGMAAEVAQVDEGVRSALLPVHVSVNILGIAAFALAFAVAVAYIIQEQMLRRRQLSGIFQRLPALDVLDSLGLRLVTIGFPLFTVGVLTGSLWAVRTADHGLRFSAGQGFAVLAWGFFGTVLLSRAAAGWRGRRAAIGTMLGFLCALVALLGYVLRGFGATT